MEKHTKKLRKAVGKIIHLDKSVLKPGQAMLLNNFTKHNSAIFYRQSGKSHFVYKINDQVVFDPDLDMPSTLLMSTTKDQTNAIYRPHLDKVYKNLRHGKEKVMTYKDDISTYVFNRAFKGLEGYGYLEVGGCGSGDERSPSARAKRGRTKDLVCLDEYGDFPPDYYGRVVKSHTDVRDAPDLKTGTAKPGHFEKDFKYREQKMRSGDRDFFTMKWSILHGLKYGEVTQEFVDKTYEYYFKTNQLVAWESEYMLNFKAYLLDRPFGRVINNLYEDKRVRQIPLPEDKLVDTFWDLGVNGTTCWIRYQTTRGGFVYIKYLEQMEDVYFPDFVKDKFLPYILGKGLSVRFNVLPADGDQRELHLPHSRLIEAQRILPGRTISLPVVKNIDDALNHTKGFLRDCHFDKEGCLKGLDRLELFEYKGKGVPKDRKIKHHHCADAFVISAMFNGDYMDPGLVQRARNERYRNTDREPETGFTDPSIRTEKEYLINQHLFKDKRINNWGY